MYKKYVIDPKEWDLWLDGTPDSDRPRRCMYLKDWAAANPMADLVMNLTFFNFDTKKAQEADTVYQCLQELYIKRYNSFCGWGKHSEVPMILPNGDYVYGYSTGILNGQVKDRDTKTASCRKGMGMTQDGKYVIVECSEYVTLKAFFTQVNTMIPNMKYFLQMDGGGSVGTLGTHTGLMFAPKKEGTYGRKVASVLCLRYKGNITRTLKQGCKGDDVKALQMMCAILQADGIYGADTKAKVRTGQKNSGLDDDGIAGPITQKKWNLRR